MHNEPTNSQEASLLPMLSADSSTESPSTQSQSSLVVGVGSSKKVHQKLEGELQLEEEADRLLDGLGPRFSDWWGCDPLPIDADLLPAVVPGFRKPFRLLPFGIKPKLTDREMTILKRLGRPLPCHFALGEHIDSLIKSFLYYMFVCFNIHTCTLLKGGTEIFKDWLFL